MILSPNIEPRSHNGCDAVKYRNASTEWLFDYSRRCRSKTVSRFAAAGIVRALLDVPADKRENVPFIDSINWATENLLSLQYAGARKPVATPSAEIEDFVYSLPNVNNSELDKTSIGATNANIPDRMAEVINETTLSNDPKLIIGLGHGGILASLATYSAMPEDSAYYPVRYSRLKLDDTNPVLAEQEKEYIRQLAVDRIIVVHDEDTYTGGTLRRAVTYMADMLGGKVYGAAPHQCDGIEKFHPTVIQNRPSE